MQYALIDGDRVEANRGLNAVCPLCRAPVIPKCGAIVVHHWAHLSKKDCDDWWEPETPWHRKWKACATRTEVTIQKHRADIVTSRGLIVELQHSNLSLADVRAREDCYGLRLRWLFDGTDLLVSAPNGEFLSRQTSSADVRSGEELAVNAEGETYRVRPVRVFEGEYGLTKMWLGEKCSVSREWDGERSHESMYVAPLAWNHFDNHQLDLRKKSRSKEGWEIVTFRWKHPRKSYAMTQRPTYIDLPGRFVLRLGALHLDGGPPYGGWGTLVPRAVVEGWMQ